MGAVSAMFDDVLAERLDLIEYVVEPDTTPTEMLALAKYIDDEATVLACIAAFVGTEEERLAGLVWGMAHIQGVPWDDDKQMPVLGDDLTTERNRNYIRSTAHLVEVVGDHERCRAYIEASQVVSALIRGRVSSGEA
jgi:hypothetical protein